MLDVLSLLLRSTTGSKIVTHKGIRKELIEEQPNKELYDIKELPMQDRLADNDGADYFSSQNIFRNHKVADELIQFWYKARHNVLRRYYTLSLWYSDQSATCALDGSIIESASHLLNDCKKFKHNCTRRHDRLIEKKGEEIKSNENTIINSKTARTALTELGVEIENENDELLNLKPDIIVKERTRMNILDIVCPYDVYIIETYELMLESIRTSKYSLKNRNDAV